MHQFVLAFVYPIVPKPPKHFNFRNTHQQFHEVIWAQAEREHIVCRLEWHDVVSPRTTKLLHHSTKVLGEVTLQTIVTESVASYKLLHHVYHSPPLLLDLPRPMKTCQFKMLVIALLKLQCQKD